MSDFHHCSTTQADAAADAEQRRVALGYLGEAWDEAAVDGLDPDCLAQAAIFLAFQELVATYGEEPAAVFAEALAERIRAGEYTVQRTHQ
ncbi:hypothetical protein [Blastochloris viridis]|uniref:Uncharacterized protein n=1 Tax=Blastochloris viridis TaxID=1079 RepID=A0A0H5BQ50_BLAVI|nr:hypothetical protein [Blastochloris viridis]ALK09751.1 hypothetical protein BVIR_1981 [Blastochloris viridis]BAS00354.1 hypothetical protein BV133_2760 [Blastochloris viridis]CUU42414.1 hypothetical protein BVIRIDIS_14260 [Blastochloris viridis]